MNTPRGLPRPKSVSSLQGAALLILALLPNAFLFADQTASGTLLKPVRIDLRAEGRVIGSATLPAGTRLEVLGSLDGVCQARRNPSEAPFDVPAEAIRVEAAASTPTPSPRPSVIPEVSPQATALAPPKATTPATHEPTASEVNRAMGIPLFGEGSLWEENDAMVAKRLRWPQESLTSYEAGYRRYPYTFNSDTRVFGVRALSLFLQGVGEKTARASILFANKGDIAFYMSPEELARQKPDQPLNVTDGMMRGFREALRTDAASVRDGLRSLFGSSRSVSLGRFQQTREQAERWDWKGHSFLLVELPGEYVALRILPTAVLDDDDSSRKAFAAAKRGLASRVKRAPSGDVIISDIPMVDQGRKGYCVPATFERLLRYYGLAADMNVLAMAGRTEAGGGTSIGQIEVATQTVVYDAGGTIASRNFTGSIGEIKPFIDAGKPLIFAHCSTEEFNSRVNERMKVRGNFSPADWSSKVLPDFKKRNAAPLKPDSRYGHVCLIIGYNEKTREIAITDSWGEAATERWMTEEEARQIMQPTGLAVIE